MSKVEDLALEALDMYAPKGINEQVGLVYTKAAVLGMFKDGYHQAEKDVAEAFARIIRGNLGGIGNGIQNMFEQLYTDITGEKMYKGFKD